MADSLKSESGAETTVEPPRERRVFSSDNTIRWRWAILAALAGVAAFFLSQWASRAPFLIERWYTGGIWPVFSRPLSVVTGFVPFSVAELLLIGYVLWTGWLVACAVGAAVTRNRRWTNVVAGGVWRALVHGGLAVAFFYSIWGLNYSRPSFEARMQWPTWDGIETEELVELATQAVEAANTAYISLHGTPDLGRPTGPPENQRELDRAIDDGWSQAAAMLDMDPVVGRSFGPVKNPLSSRWIAHLGISGLYVPFTGEATVLSGLPWMRSPLSMAHEKAHQRGVTTEAEATFLGFVATALAPDPLAQYSAAVHAMNQLMSSLRRPDREVWQRLSRSLHPGITRDLADFSEYVSQFEGVPDRVQTAVNDRYLRVNRVPGGVQNYSLSARLLVELARQQGGVLMPSGR